MYPFNLDEATMWKYCMWCQSYVFPFNNTDIAVPKQLSNCTFSAVKSSVEMEFTKFTAPSSEEAEMVVALKHRFVEAEVSHSLCETAILRFLRGRKGDVDKVRPHTHTHTIAIP